jgi:serine protease
VNAANVAGQGTHRSNRPPRTVAVVDDGAVPRSARALVAVLAAGVVGLGAAGAQPVADDPVFEQGLQWGLERIGAPDAWATATGDGVTIAIVDSGADLAHEDLADRITAQVSCIGAAGDPAGCTGSAQDDNGHGTHVAGIAAAATGNGRGVAGVAPDADLMIVRVLADVCTDLADRTSCTATGTAGDVVAGIRWAVDNGADVINLSLGGGATTNGAACAFCDAVSEAWDAGAIPVIAAGNDVVLPDGFADEPAVVVAATTRDDERSSYSGEGSGLLAEARWPVAAPGGEGETDPGDCATGGRPQGILSTYWAPGESDQYACLAGTSMAAPHVSGALAVLLSQGRSPDDAVDQLLATAVDLGPTGRDGTFGEGRIDLAAAVATPVTSTTAPRSPATTTTAAPPVTAGEAPAPEAPPVGPPEASDPVTVPVVDDEVAAPAPEAAVDEVPAALAWAATAAVLGAAAATTAVALGERRRRAPG